MALQKKKSKCMVTGRRSSLLLAVSGKADLHWSAVQSEILSRYSIYIHKWGTNRWKNVQVYQMYVSLTVYCRWPLLLSSLYPSDRSVASYRDCLTNTTQLHIEMREQFRSTVIFNLRPHRSQLHSFLCRKQDWKNKISYFLVPNTFFCKVGDRRKLIA